MAPRRWRGESNPQRLGMVLGVVIGVAVAIGIVAVVKALSATPAPARGGFAFVRSDTARHATIWAVGDADASRGAGRVVARIASEPFHHLLYLGDVYDDGTPGEFAHNFALGRFARVTAPTPGNHDWDNHATGYDPYWRKALHRSRTAHWYAFRSGGWRIISLNSETALGRTSAQGRWLATQLRGRGTCRLAFWHRPRYNAGEHGDAEDVAPLWDALRGHAAIVLNGHDHNMQRMRPVGGITQFVSGAGGKSHYDVDRGYGRLAFADDEHFGALRLDLRPGSASYAFVSTDGSVLDAGTVRCRA